MDSKVIPPVFSNSISTHQPVTAQLSMPSKETEKLGAGVGVGEGVGLGGGVNSGRTLVFPATVAYAPHNQQN